MRFLIQRVNHASVTVDDKEVGKIGKGLLVFVGVFEEDTEEVADKLIRKLLGLRIFADEKANALYEYVLSACREKIAVTESGIFGADMRVDLSNDGPFTILFDSREM